MIKSEKIYSGKMSRPYDQCVKLLSGILIYLYSVFPLIPRVYLGLFA